MASLRLFRSGGSGGQGKDSSSGSGNGSTDSPPRGARPTSLYSLSGGVDAAPSITSSSSPSGHAPPLDVLLLGSGWTSSFLLPALHSVGLSFAYTNRSGLPSPSLVVPQRPLKWVCPEGGASRLQWRKAVRPLPSARLVLVVMPLKDPAAAKELVLNYEALLRERGAERGARWCVLGSTGVWGPGSHGASSPITSPSPRSTSEDAVLALLRGNATVLNLAGLYGGATRHPLNWLAKVAGDQQKLLGKTSLHLLHGRDLARAVLGVWEQSDHEHEHGHEHGHGHDHGAGKTESVWGRRWIVTDGRVYDWWQLALDLPVQPQSLHAQYQAWIGAFTKEYETTLPRPSATDLQEHQPPKYLDRALDSSHFWAAIGLQPVEGPAHEVDLPLSPLDGRAVSSTATATATATAAASEDSIPASEEEQEHPIHAISPTLPKGKLEDLVAALKAEIAREEKWPAPDVLEGHRAQWGLTRGRFLQLRRAWLEFLTSSSSSPSGWTATWAEFSSLPHYLLPLPDLIAPSSTAGTHPGIHFIRLSPPAHVRATRRVTPLLILPGWPSSVYEHLALARALADPGQDVPLDVPAFDCVLPSYPGYLFSGSASLQVDEKTGEVRGPFSGPGGDLLLADVSDLLHSLMLRLGFHQGFGLHATDFGSAVARSLAARHPEVVTGAHFNFLPAPPPPHLEPPIVPKGVWRWAAERSSWVEKVWGLPRAVGAGAYLQYADGSDEGSSPDAGSYTARLTRLLGLPAPLSPSDAARVQRTLTFQAHNAAYAQMHATRPSTLGLALGSSPSALLTWVGEKWLGWVDARSSEGGSAEGEGSLLDSQGAIGQVEEEVLHKLLTTLTLYWLTDTAPRCLWPYRNRPPSAGGLPGIAAHAGLAENYIPASVHVGYSDFPRELMPAPLAWVKGTVGRLAWYREHGRGGHFPAVERPVELAGDLREFFGGVGKGGGERA